MKANVRTWTPQVILALMLVMAALTSVHAADGVIEINEARALAGGVTPGDSPGYPVTLGNPGSYVLTGNLVVDSENVTVVEITAEELTLDLNGFGIRGPVRCNGSPPSCAPEGGTGHGILIQSDRVTIKDGFVRGLGADGISGPTTSQVRIDNVDLWMNGQSCVDIGTLAVIRGSRATRCGSHGFKTLNSALVVDSIAAFNGGAGLFTTSGTELNSGYRSNVLERNSGGTAVGNPVELGPNICDGDTVCP